MTHKTQLRIWEWASYVLIIGATVVYLIMKTKGIMLTLIILLLALFSRLMMERVRRSACEAENEELKADLRRLTQLLAEEKKRNK